MALLAVVPNQKYKFKAVPSTIILEHKCHPNVTMILNLVIYGFLYVYNRNEVSICRCFGYICETRIWSARGNYALNHVLLVHIVFQNKTTKKRNKQVSRPHIVAQRWYILGLTIQKVTKNETIEEKDKKSSMVGLGFEPMR